MSDADLNEIIGRRRGSGVKVTPRTHGGSVPVPIEVLLDPDPELRLVWAPMTAWVDHDDDPLDEEPYADIPGAGQRGC